MCQEVKLWLALFLNAATFVCTVPVWCDLTYLFEDGRIQPNLLHVPDVIFGGLAGKCLFFINLSLLNQRNSISYGASRIWGY